MVSELIVFDCDGVLVDSEVLVIEIEAELLTAAGFTMTSAEIAERFVGLSYGDMMSAIATSFGREVPSELMEQVRSEPVKAFPDRLQPIDGIGAVLADLELPRCVASSSDIDRIALSLQVTGLDQYFEPASVFSAQMVENGKPAPDLFLHAASSLGVQPDKCVVIEDSPHGVAAGVAAGMRVIGFTGGGHATDSLSGRLLAAGAEVVVDHAADLPAHF